MALTSREGRFLRVNAALCELTGRSEAQLLELRFADITHPDDLERDVRNQEMMRDGELESIDVEKRYLRPDGSTVWVRLVANPVLDDDGKPSHNVAQLEDITLRREAAIALAESLARERSMADEQAALRRVATAVASEMPSADVFTLVAEEVARLVGAERAVIERRDGPEQGTVVGEWPDGHDRALAADAVLLAVVVRAGTRVWGGLEVTGWEGDATVVCEQLARFADLVGLAIASADARAQLIAQASSDPLTGLLNHRVFHEQLRVEAERAQRHGRPLALVLMDVDRFKEVNDAWGHQAGDDLLIAIAEVIRRGVRAIDLIGRLGGDEFGLLLPETAADSALQTAERLRSAIAETNVRSGTVTVSAGVSDLAEAGGTDELVALADGALYWAKSHGRDLGIRYEPNVVEELSSHERVERLARSQALTGLRALARAVDAKDHSTFEHSERVAALAAKIAHAADWPAARIGLLREAAMVHDVGKIGVPDAILLRDGPLSDDEYEQVKTHVVLSARIASEVLADEQVDWISSHHERHDGRGYPAALAGDAIPMGGRMLAVADAWDAMTVARPYGAPLSYEQALEEVRTQTGRQFAPDAVALLEQLAAAGQLP